MTASPGFRWAAVFLLAVLFATGGAALWWRHTLWTPADNPRSTLEIQTGAASMAILQQLAQAGVMPSVLAGRLYLEGPARGREMHWGTYVIPARSRPVDILEVLLQGRVKQLTLTVVEGTNSSDIQGILEAAGVMDTDLWPLLTGDSRMIADLAPGASSLEGFLFPDTYTFSTGVDAPTVARVMVDRFRTVWAQEYVAGRQSQLTTLDLVTLASLVEAETGVAQERERVAGVFVNRLDRGMLLQCDPTVVFALQRRGEWTGRLLRVHWNVDDPYNTYQYPGLPPAPINNPGRAALRAAMNPEKHTLLYFVADDSGGHTFSSTLKQHNLAVAKRRRSRH